MQSKLEDVIGEFRELSLHTIVDYDKFNQYAITAHSTQIEGSTLTLEETSLLIDEGITPKGKPLDHSLMATEHHKALQLAIQYGKEQKRLSTSLICSMNAVAMKSTGQVYNTPLGTVDASKGELRKGSVFVQKRYFPSYQKVPTLLEGLCRDINVQLESELTLREQVDLSYIAHFNLVSNQWYELQVNETQTSRPPKHPRRRIHPHYDGNGRTARLLMNMIQSHYGLPLSIVDKTDKLAYYDALEESRDRESLVPFIEFMDEQYINFLTAEMERYHKQTGGDGSHGMTFLF